MIQQNGLDDLGCVTNHAVIPGDNKTSNIGTVPDLAVPANDCRTVDCLFEECPRVEDGVAPNFRIVSQNASQLPHSGIVTATIDPDLDRRGVHPHFDVRQNDARPEVTVITQNTVADIGKMVCTHMIQQNGSDDLGCVTNHAVIPGDNKTSNIGTVPDLAVPANDCRTVDHRCKRPLEWLCRFF
jgi:flavoprotein